MSKRTRATSEENPAPEAEEDQDPPAETRRTRSGRRVRTPAVLSSSEAPARTPGRRTRRSVLQEQPAQEERKAEEEPEETSIEAESAGSEAPAAEAEMEAPAAETGAPAAVAEMEAPAADTGAPAAEAEVEAPAAEMEMEALAAHSDQTELNGGPRPTETAPVSSDSIPQKKPRLAPSVKQTPVVPLGKPKSGRVWKDRNKQRFSALVRDKPLCSSWEKKMEAKREKELMKKYSLQLKEEKDRQKEDKRKRREENLRRRAENERKAEIVQVIRNTAKIKRMKKKQLRKIEKRDTLAMLQQSQKQNVKTKAPKNH